MEEDGKKVALFSKLLNVVQVLLKGSLAVLSTYYNSFIEP
jgi:hypothetical protein